MGKGQKRTRDSDAAAAPTAPAANPVPSKRQPPVIPEGFPGPRSGFLLQHSRSASSGGGDKTAVTANADAVSADSSYISAMISLIPPEYYVPKSEEEKEATWTKYSKNKKGIMPKQSIKEASKKAKRARYDPTTGAAASVPALQAALDKADTERAKSVVNGMTKAEKAAKRNGMRNGAGRPDEIEIEPALSFGVVKAKIAGVKAPSSVEVGGVPVRVEPTPADKAVNKEGHRKVSLKKLLAQAEANQSRLEDLRQKFVKGETGEIAPDEMWEPALARATGLKVRDDPKLLRLSLRKERQKKARSARKWAERAATVEKDKADRQAKRSENIQKRKEGKSAKGRAGFEGKKRSFLNDSAGGKE